MFCSAEIQLPKRPLNLLSTSLLALSSPLTQIFRRIFLQGPSPIQPSRWYHSEDFFLMEFCLKEAWELTVKGIYHTRGSWKHLINIRCIFLINNRRKNFQVLYTVQKNEEWIKMQSRFKRHLENKLLKKKIVCCHY